MTVRRDRAEYGVRASLLAGGDEMKQESSRGRMRASRSPNLHRGDTDFGVEYITVQVTAPAHGTLLATVPIRRRADRHSLTSLDFFQTVRRANIHMVDPHPPSNPQAHQPSSVTSVTSVTRCHHRRRQSPLHKDNSWRLHSGPHAKPHAPPQRNATPRAYPIPAHTHRREREPVSLSHYCAVASLLRLDHAVAVVFAVSQAQRLKTPLQPPPPPL